MSLTEEDEEMPVAISVHAWSKVTGKPLIQLVFEDDLYPFASNSNAWSYILAHPNDPIRSQVTFNWLLIGTHCPGSCLRLLRYCDRNVLLNIRAYIGYQRDRNYAISASLDWTEL